MTAYTLTIVAANGTTIEHKWNCREMGQPTASNLTAFVAKYNASIASGANRRLGAGAVAVSATIRVAGHARLAETSLHAKTVVAEVTA